MLQNVYFSVQNLSAEIRCLVAQEKEAQNRTF